MNRPNTFECDFACAFYEAHLAGPATDADVVTAIANALAEQRARLTRLAASLLEGLDATHGGLSATKLDAFDAGWTPRQVHELVRAHRDLIESISAARELLPRLLAGVQ